MKDEETKKLLIVALSHELGHSVIRLRDPYEFENLLPMGITINVGGAGNIPLAEEHRGLLKDIGIRCGGNVTFVENPIRKMLSMPERRTYGGTPVPTPEQVDKADRELFDEFKKKHGLP